MAKPRYYRRLTRNRSGLGTYSSLWCGPDHLLLVSSTGVSENYQRFYFRDIQALVVSPSSRFLVLLSITGGLLLLCLVAVLLSALLSDGAALPGIVVAALPILVFFFWNLVLGNTCHVTLMSGVQTLRLAPLSRRRRTRRVFATIVPLIEAAQAALATTPHTAPVPGSDAPLAGPATT